MAEPAQYNHENMPMKDILAEIRQMVSSEAQARYNAERTQAKKELLILRPEARVDLLLQEATPDIEVKATPVIPKAPKASAAKTLAQSLEAEVFKTKLEEAIGVSDPEALEALIRKVFQEELEEWGES